MGIAYSDDLNPSEVTDYYWVGDDLKEEHANTDIGKWMLFYPADNIDDKWKLAKSLYRCRSLNGVTSMKCSTAKDNPRASSRDFVIILYCSNSGNREHILSIGKVIAQAFEYETSRMYYKTDKQTDGGTIATGQKRNHTYVLTKSIISNKWS